MSHILGVKFRDAGQIYYFDSGPFVVSTGESVIVNTEQGYGLGLVVQVCDEPPKDVELEEMKPIYRIAASEDLEKQEENIQLAEEAFEYCRQCIRERKLEMKLVDVEVFFDRSKIIFYFTAPNRIDFRELVKDLVRNYRTRIELRQIGVRHETQMVGAVGNCGQVCCCRRFLRKFAPVTIRMAKEQNLFLNPTKISGMCGRLLCCLSYEQSNYEEFHRNCPKVGKKYITTDGPYKVLRANLFRSSLSVLRDGGEEQEMTLEEWAALEPRRPEQHELQEKKQDRKAPGNGRDDSPGPSQGQQRGGPRRPQKLQAQPEQDAEQAPAPEPQGADAEQAPDGEQQKQPAEGQEQQEGQGKRKRSRPRNRNKPRQPKAKDGQQPRQAKPQEKPKSGKSKRKRRRKPKTTQSE